MKLKGIVFDFDGVIADSESLHFKGYRDVLVDEGVVLTQSEYLSRYLGYDDVGAFEAIAVDKGRRWSSPQIAGMVAKKALRLEILAHDHSLLFPGAAAAIVRLSAACPLAIASGALRVEIERTLRQEGLSRYFVTVVGADDVPASKPAPDPYLKAIRSLAGGADPLAAEYVAIEDSRWGLESARAAGLKTVAVTHTYPAAALEADLTVSNLDTLTAEVLENLVSSVSN
jgi:HAD superfamily hydrolase (TIGR01509 family)